MSEYEFDPKRYDCEEYLSVNFKRILDVYTKNIRHKVNHTGWEHILNHVEDLKFIKDFEDYEIEHFSITLEPKESEDNNELQNN